tara:strand:- start:189 stop:632 length:444 start_codon:yes stop_codon:yes gene_type:complete
MKKDFVMRGKLATGDTEVLNFSGHKKGYAYKLKQLDVYPGSGIGTSNFEGAVTITAGRASINPLAPDFSDEGLIGTAYYGSNTAAGTVDQHAVINDTFMITQDLIIEARDASGNGLDVNYQCRFESVKMSGSEEAVANYRQFVISDE